MLLAVSVAAAAWALAVELTGGFVVRYGALRFSSRNPRNPLVMTILGALASCALSSLPGVRGTLLDEWSWWRRRGTGLVSSLQRHSWLYGASTAALLGVVLDVFQWAGAPSLWLDEEMIALNVRDRAFADLRGTLWLGQSAPLGWLVAERAILLTLGAGELASRLLALCFGIATLVAALWVGRRWMSRLGAVVLVVLCSLGQWLSHYRLEVKHYSADAFWGLMLPAQAAWVIDAERTRDHLRRSMIWWVAAAAGQWFANGALLVTPACGLLLLAVTWRRHGWRAGAVFAVSGLIWLASFWGHYQLSLQVHHHNEFLRGYWAPSCPCSRGLHRDGTLGPRPGGAARTGPRGDRVAGGAVALRHLGGCLPDRPALGAAFATVPLSALAWVELRARPAL